jgi:hypothetical protein
MAGVTIHPERRLVLVVGLVAGVTTGLSILKCGGQVAFLTGRSCMQSDKREAGQVMVEYHLFRPAGLLVTAFAALPLLTAMNIVAGVAIVALG